MKQIYRHSFAAGMLIALLLCVSACTSIPAPAPKKVQTYEELFLKLKEGFYSGRLMEEEFYAKELGYPLKAALRFLPNNVKDLDREQILKLDEKNFQFGRIIVWSVTANGQRTVYTRFESGNANPCLAESDFIKIWEPHNLTKGNDPAYHRRYAPGVVPLPIYFWRAKHTKTTMQMSAGFEASGQPVCLQQASLSVSDIKE
jgi:hypothetical protein